MGAGEEVATFEEEGAKEAPAEYILPIIKKIFPHAVKIENVKDIHEPGVDWLIYWRNGNITEIDDKNDLHLGYTGNISIDEKTLEKKDVIQLFVNITLPEKHLFVYNNFLSKNYVEANAVKKHGRLQTWGKYTYTYILPVKFLKHRIYEIYPNLVNPSIEYFTRRHKRELNK